MGARVETSWDIQMILGYTDDIQSGKLTYLLKMTIYAFMVDLLINDCDFPSYVILPEGSSSLENPNSFWEY